KKTKRSQVAGKLLVHELAKQLGITSKELPGTLKEQGEFVKTASSTIEPPVVKKMRAHYDAQGIGKDNTEAPTNAAPAKPAAKPGAPKPGAPKPAAPKPAAAKPAAAKPTPAKP